MAKTTGFKGAFSSGEVAPSMYGRVAMPQYQNGAKRILNYIVKPQGGIENRPGTEYVVNAGEPGRLIPFSYNTEQSYHLLFTATCLRIVKDGGFVLRPLSDDAEYKWTISTANPHAFYLTTDADGDPGLVEPAADEVYAYGYQCANEASPATLDNNSIYGKWSWGDIDSLGFDTIYIAFGDIAIPSPDNGYIGPAIPGLGDTVPYIPATVGNDLTIAYTGDPASYTNTVGNDLAVTDNDTTYYIASTVGNTLTVTAPTEGNRDIAKGTGSFTSADIGKTVRIITASNTTTALLQIISIVESVKARCSITYGSQAAGTITGGLWGFSDEEVENNGDYILTADSAYPFSSGDVGKTIWEIDGNGAMQAAYLVKSYVSTTVVTADLIDGTVTASVTGGLWDFSDETITFTGSFTLTAESAYFDDGSPGSVGDNVIIISLSGVPIGTFEITSVTSTTVVECDLVSGASQASVSGGKWGFDTDEIVPGSGSDYTVCCVSRTASPYAYADLALLKFAPAADVLYITHPSYAQRTLTRTDHYAWTFATESFTLASCPLSSSYLRASYSHAITTPRQIKYKISTVTDGVETLPSADILCYADKPWDSGASILVSWKAVSGVDEYRIYKCLRGYYGWIGTVNNDSRQSTDYACNGSTTTFTITWPFETLPNQADEDGNRQRGMNLIVEKITVSTGAVATVLTYTDGAPSGDQYKVTTNYTAAGGNGVVTVGTAYANTFKIRITEAFTYKDDNVDPDVGDSYRRANDPFESSNNPACCAIYQQRMMYGGLVNDTGKFAGSVTGDWNNFSISRPLKGDDCIEANLASARVDEIRHMLPLKQLVILTSGSEWVLAPASNESAVTATSIQLNVQSYRGCSQVPPLLVGSTILFVSRDGQTVYDFGYFFSNDRYETMDMSVMAQHLFENRTVKEWAYQQRPNSVIWCVMDDGTLLSLTYLKEHEVWAWAQHSTDGTFESVSCIPGLNTYDEVAFIVKRSINGSTVYYVEVLAERLPDDDDTLGVFLDSALTTTLTGDATTLTGLNHLEGKTVWALVQGNPVKDLVVSGGSVTLPYEAQSGDYVIVGLPIPTPTTELLPLEIEGAYGKKRRITKAIVRVENTRGLRIGFNTDNMIDAKWSIPSTDGLNTTMRTGDVEVLIPAQWGFQTSLVIQQPDPLPQTIAAIMPEVDIGG